MPKYDLNGLEPRTFQQLAQALAIAELGTPLTVYGDGPDGGRDASHSGRLNYETLGRPWHGYTIIQAKFRQKPSGKHKIEAKWLSNEIVKEMAKFTGKRPKYRRPDFYLLITNLELTATNKTGTDARIRKLLADYAKKLPLQGIDIWDAIKVQRLLDKHATIAVRYGGFITAGDVLAEMHTLIKGLKPNFETVMSDFLQSEISGTDQYARLKEAGGSSERKTPLAQVFVDLPTSDQPRLDPPDEKPGTQEGQQPGFTALVQAIAGLRLDNESVLSRTAVSRRENAWPESGRFVLIGGPGQGKSTLSQFICQLYRAAILQNRPRRTLSPETRNAIAAITDRCTRDHVDLPKARRFPMRVELKNLADDLAKGACVSLIDYIAKQIDKRSCQTIDRSDLQLWLEIYPWLLILDGLDEVPTSSNRAEVLEEINCFSAQCATRAADILIIATSRPQGYGQAFERQLYCHQYLLPLSAFRALHYAGALTDACYAHDPELRSDILNRLTNASVHPTTQRLMRSPLQVTILTILAELRGELPHDRWQLFQEYYQTIYSRETQRNLELSSTLREYDLEIAHLHEHAGLYLQAANEAAGETDALLTEEEFSVIVRKCLSERFEGRDRERERVAKRITDAALERLVFLVPPRDQGIGFEIRSLQEFMAARALMEGSDKEICDRLRTIAPYPYWRNVFLFAAGKCVRDRRHLVENIIGICQTVNTTNEDPALTATLTGSVIALDLLEDGTFRLLPRYGRALAEVALKLLNLPFDQEHARLGEVCKSNPELDPIFRSEVDKRLSQPATNGYQPAWSVILALLNSSRSWATELANRHWPAEPSRQWEIIRSRPSYFNVSWLLKRIGEIVKYVGPTFFNYGRDARLFPHDEIPPWLSALISVLYSRDEERRIPVRLGNGMFAPITLRFSSAFQPANPWQELLGLKEPAGNWTSLLAAARFVLDPTKETLSKQLSLLAKHDNRPAHGPWHVFGLPWPLAFCLECASGSAELANLARRVLEGEFGSTEEWVAQENKWCFDGVQTTELTANESIDAAPAWTAFTCFVDSDSSDNADNLDATVSSLLEEYAECHRPQGKKYLAYLALSCLEVKNLRYRTANPKKLRFCPPPRLLQELIEAVQNQTDVADVVRSLPIPSPLPDDWADFFDWSGRECERLFSTEGSDERLVDDIATAYLRSKDRSGLVAWIETLIWSHEMSNFQKITNFEPNDSFETKRRKLSIRLACGCSQPEEVQALVAKAAEILTAEEETTASWSIFGALEHFQAEDWVGAFLLQMMPLLVQPKDEQLLHQCLRQLAEWVSYRRSPLHDKDCRSTLGLAWLAPET